VVGAKTAGKARAVADAVQVFAWTLVLVGIVHWLLGPLERWITRWPVVEYIAMLAVPLLWLYWTSADPADYGLGLGGLREQLRTTLRCGIPFSAFALLSFVDWGRYALLASMGAGLGALLLFGCVLRKRPAAGGAAAAAAPCLMAALLPHGLSAAAGGVIFYLLLLGPGEEVLFRGAIQSRLNAAFGRPFELFGARWGWGAVLASVLFSLMHVLNLPALYEGHWAPLWWAGPVTFCLALPFAYLRERTGSVVAPALLHAFPQAIVFAIRTMVTG